MGGMGGGMMGGMMGGGQQRCFKCDGKGFCHDSSMHHDKGPEEKCFFCSKCNGCLGSGHIRGGSGGMPCMGGHSGMASQQPCFKCEGRGFCHDSSMTHDKPHGEKCFFCSSCSGCGGKGAISGGGMGGGGFGGKQACFKCHRS